MKMPKTRSQVKQTVLKKTRGSRKRFTNVVVNCDPFSFEFLDFQQTEMGNTEQMAATVAKESMQKISERSSARTRPYDRPEDKIRRKRNEGTISQDEITIIEEKINQMSVFTKPKPVWITHQLVCPIGGGAASLEEGALTDKSSSQEGSDVGVGDDCANRGNRSMKKDGLPRYLLDPNAFASDPAEKERILKSIYDKNRREADMKNKLSLLKQENMYLRRMLLFTASKNKEKVGGVVISPCPVATKNSPRPVATTTVPPQPFTKTISPSASIFNSNVPFQTGPVLQPKKPCQMKEVSQKRDLSTGNEKDNLVMCPPPMPLPKRQKRATSYKPRLQKKNGVKKPSLEERKEFIRNLYKKFDEEENEDIDSIIASLIGTSSSQPSTTTTDAEMNRRKETMALENTNEKTVMYQQQEANDSDEIQIIKEIELPAKVAKKLTEKYANVIFEAAV